MENIVPVTALHNAGQKDNPLFGKKMVIYTKKFVLMIICWEGFYTS